MLINNSLGNYRFLEGNDFFCSGVVSHSGYEIVHATFHRLPPLHKGFALIEDHLKQVDRSLNALCGIELRMPRPLSEGEFRAFNRSYIQRLAEWHLLVEDLNPVARTNVAPEARTVLEPSVYGFSYTLPSPHPDTSFVVTGVPEIQFRDDGRLDIPVSSEKLEAGLREKAERILRILEMRLQAIQASWNYVTAVGIYTVRDIHPLLATTILPVLKGAGTHGIHWHYAWPPVIDLELEVDLRAVRQEIVLLG